VFGVGVGRYGCSSSGICAVLTIALQLILVRRASAAAARRRSTISRVARGLGINVGVVSG